MSCIFCNVYINVTVSLCTSLSNRLQLQFQCKAPNPLRRPENIKTAVKNDKKYSLKLLCDLLHFKLIKIIFSEVINKIVMFKIITYIHCVI